VLTFRVRPVHLVELHEVRPVGQHVFERTDVGTETVRCDPELLGGSRRAEILNQDVGSPPCQRLASQAC